MSNRYKEKVKTEWGISKHVIQCRKKGMLVYREMRVNHLDNTNQMRGHGAFPVQELDYLIFDIPDDVDGDQFLELFDNGWTGLQIRWFAGWTEISCQYTELFQCGLLQKMQELGYIKHVHKEIPSDKNEIPFYVNAKGWRLLYNQFHIIRKRMKSIGKTSWNQSNQSEDTPMHMENERG
ncbi:hypothetical protein ACFVS2_21035 [Brevibacillus sp. NPDC058079]|uniref:hypothetical protein n=1 Tax=Brevibacillus sp. NPDC058079 TaxID=3346330 RepID=UPI0036EEB9D1